MNRRELLEMLLEQSEELEKTKLELEDTKRLLEDRDIRIAKAGNIAEAVLSVNDIFGNAQRIADEYIANVKKECDRKIDAIIPLYDKYPGLEQDIAAYVNNKEG